MKKMKNIKQKLKNRKVRRAAASLFAAAFLAMSCNPQPDTHTKQKTQLVQKQHNEKHNIDSADVDARYGITPLMRAASTNDVKKVLSIINSDSEIEYNINLKDSEGRTALHWAVNDDDLKDDEEDVKVVKILIEHGADVNAKDKSGKTALDYALESNSTRVAALLKKLKKAGAKE